MKSILPPNNGVPKLDIIKTNPEAAAIMSKALVARTKTGFDIKDQRTYYSLNQAKIQAISDKQKERLGDNENILELFPDIKLAEQIVISSILAPKDMLTGSLIYQTSSTLLPDSIQAKITDVIRSQVEKQYAITDELPDALRDALFRTGSYCIATIPEAAIDEIINGRAYAAESDRTLISELIGSNGMSTPQGLLGPMEISNDPVISLESFFNNTLRKPTNGAVSLEAIKNLPDSIDKVEIKEGKSVETKITNAAKEIFKKLFNGATDTSKFLEITDNWQVLKLSKLMGAIATQRVKNSIKRPGYTSYARESLDDLAKLTVNTPSKIGTQEFHDRIYKANHPGHEPFVAIPSKDAQKRYSIGRPLRVRIPSEAIVPVFPPGDPSNHRGYFVLVDAEGNWVTSSSMDLTNTGLQGLLNNQGQSAQSGLLTKAKRNIVNADSAAVLDNMLEVYSSIVENEMLIRLKNGVYGATMDMGKDKEWDRIMLARALAGKMTRLVYIPSEIVTYYAFDYHKNGVGKSLLDDIKTLTSLRATLLFSKVMAQMKNSINVTKVDVKLDKDDPDPQKTIETAAHDVAHMREQYLPLGVNSPADMVDWLSRAGLQFTFSGHPGLPETSFDFSTGALQHAVPDQGTEDNLRKMTFMAFGLTPEQVDEGFSPQFATTILVQNALFAKRIALLSDRTAKHLTKDVQNICSNDAIIQKQISDILKEGKNDITSYLDDHEKEAFKKDENAFIYQFIERVIENIWVDLPKPDVGSLENKSIAFKEFVEALDVALTSVISEEVISSEIDGDVATHVAQLRNFWKHYIIRKWMTEESYLPQLSDIFKRDDVGNPAVDILDVMVKHVDDIKHSAVKYFEKIKLGTTAANKDLSTLNIETGSSSDTGGDTAEDTGGGDGSFDGDGVFGGDEVKEDTPDDEGGDDKKEDGSDDKKPDEPLEF